MPKLSPDFINVSYMICGKKLQQLIIQNVTKRTFRKRIHINKQQLTLEYKNTPVESPSVKVTDTVKEASHEIGMVQWLVLREKGTSYMTSRPYAS